MAKGGKIRNNRNTRARIQWDKKGSDEDYRINVNEELDESEDDYCSSLAEDEAEEHFCKVEEECVQNKDNKTGKRTGRKGFQGKEKYGFVKPKKKKVVYSEEEGHDQDDFDCVNQRNRKRRSNKEEIDDVIEVTSAEDENPRQKTRDERSRRKKAKFSYREEKKDCGYNDSEDEDDEEFMPEMDGVDDEEDLPSTKKNKDVRPRQKTRTAKVCKRKRNANVLKKTKRKKPMKNQGSRRKSRSHRVKESRDDRPAVRKKKRRIIGRRREKKLAVCPELDFVGSGSSGYQYTISEEEREQVREANEFCRSLNTAFRSSYSSKKNEKEILPPERKCQGRKGKEKVEDAKIETGKQVCGICLSEERKRTVRGALNCCSHYFCFSCIMEWSKVESRCPLCKQRFSSVSKTARSDDEHNTRSVVISVPSRDQVYQPSEEELRGYLDPYEHVLCTECQQGGDDELMLLCDICDSPAHTYCVGLGHEVPEGNWYCDGCRPFVLASSSAQGLNPGPSHGASNSLLVGSPVTSVGNSFDLNEVYVPDTPLTPGTGLAPSPRHPVHDFQASSPASGSGAYTVFERRRIQHQINQLLNNRSRQLDSINGVASVSGNSLFGLEVGRVGELVPQLAVSAERMVPEIVHLQQRLLDNTAATLSSREISSPGYSSLILHNEASTSADHSYGGLAHRESAEVNTRFGLGLGYQQFHPFSGRSNTGNGVHTSSQQLRGMNSSQSEKDQVQSMVKSHLKGLSRNMELGYNTFKDIARSSTHTILATCGLEHRWNEVYPIQRPLTCNHFETGAGMQRSLMKGQCSSCFNLFVRNVVREIKRSRIPPLSRD